MLLAESVVEGFRTCSIKNCHVIPTKTPNPYRFAVLKQDFQIMTSRALLHKNPRCKHQTSKLECVEYDRIKNFLKLCMIHRENRARRWMHEHDYESSISTNRFLT